LIESIPAVLIYIVSSSLILTAIILFSAVENQLDEMKKIRGI